MKELVTPILYGLVDISIHNDEGQFPAWRPHVKVEAENPGRCITDIRDGLVAKQQSFVNSINGGLRLGKLVRRLTWTCLAGNRDIWGDEEYRIREEPTWTAFEKMCLVESLDLASMMREREVGPPRPFFPLAQRVRLIGVMSRALARSILHSRDPSHLVELELDNVQDSGGPDDTDEPLETDPDGAPTTNRNLQTAPNRILPIVRNNASVPGRCGAIWIRWQAGARP